MHYGELTLDRKPEEKYKTDNKLTTINNTFVILNVALYYFIFS